MLEGRKDLGKGMYPQGGIITPFPSLALACRHRWTGGICLEMVGAQEMRHRHVRLPILVHIFLLSSDKYGHAT